MKITPFIPKKIRKMLQNKFDHEITLQITDLTITVLSAKLTETMIFVKDF